ncbi:hypothetical protein [Paenibacillus radicis (ex Gao et al. 2016)]|uniref:Uncharacterized protein n=1 Tax=Paenibacillus radicis (ex Gao et al. 2016) TaxID=1737354 RepID=A0A917HDE6_9BACL|nr:hypothetical protein [Paenibacillus radicis (ex Gao et al. 2016)]GGG75757.1 hypothetical protein GCM10010918_35150 [Paenibacillus radicis (ex Gao et al. 2016)]
MKLHELTFVAVRLLAVWMLIRALLFVGTTIQMIVVGSEGMMIWGISLLPALLLIGGSALFWKKAGWAALRIVGDKGEANFDWNRVPEGTLYRFGFSLVAIVIIITTLPTLIGSVAQVLQVYAQSYTISQPFLVSAWSSLVVQLAKLALAAVLLLQADVIYGWLRRTALQVRENNQ